MTVGLFVRGCCAGSGGANLLSDERPGNDRRGTCFGKFEHVSTATSGQSRARRKIVNGSGDHSSANALARGCAVKNA